MDWTGTHLINDRVALERTVARLFALAHLAALTANDPAPLRSLILALFGPAEAVARAWIAALARDCGAPASYWIEPRHETDQDPLSEAARLMLGFQELALVLQSLLSKAWYWGLRRRISPPWRKRAAVGMPAQTSPLAGAPRQPPPGRRHVLNAKLAAPRQIPSPRGWTGRNRAAICPPASALPVVGV